MDTRPERWSSAGHYLATLLNSKHLDTLEYARPNENIRQLVLKSSGKDIRPKRSIATFTRNQWKLVTAMESIAAGMMSLADLRHLTMVEWVGMSERYSLPSHVEFTSYNPPLIVAWPKSSYDLCDSHRWNDVQLDEPSSRNGLVKIEGLFMQYGEEGDYPVAEIGLITPHLPEETEGKVGFSIIGYNNRDARLHSFVIEYTHTVGDDCTIEDLFWNAIGEKRASLSDNPFTILPRDPSDTLGGKDIERHIAEFMPQLGNKLDRLADRHMQ